MARKPKLDWEAYKDQLLQLRAEKKSLTDINAILYEKTGVSVTNARLSQIFTQWARQYLADLAEKNQLRAEIGTDAN